MKTFLTIGLTAAGLAFAASQPAQAASLIICASTTCGSPGGSTNFSVNDFEFGFDVNGRLVQSGLGSPTNRLVPQAGSFVDGAAQNTFSGSWIDDGDSVPVSATVFFTDASGAISDVLNYNYSASSSEHGSVTGYVITGALTAADLAAAGITPTSTAPEGELFVFDGAFLSASVQTNAAGAVPEPSTWAMMMLGFAGLGYAGWRQSAKNRTAQA